VLLANGVNMRDAVTAAMLDTRGRGHFGAAYRSKAVTDQVDKALADAAAANSGLNFENRLRQNINKASSHGDFDNLDAAERAALDKTLIRGLRIPNMMREWGNRLGGGGGAGSLLAATAGGGAGYAYGQDPATAAAGAIAAGAGGRILRTVGNTMAQRTAERFAETLRQRSPEYASRVASAPTELGPGLPSPLSGLRQFATTSDQGAFRDALARMLLYKTTGERQNAP
jgi:hypothetical protein